MASAAARLAAVSDTPRLDAELLLAHAAGISREQLLLTAPPYVPPSFDAMLERRLSGEPIAYIVGRRGFWTVELEVEPGVLIPRPDSETLLAAAVKHFSDSGGPEWILDLGTGPGTLLLAALDQWPGATGIGVDRSERAIAIARRNADRLGMAARAEFRLGNWADGIDERFDLLLCNPPYVAEGAQLGAGVQEFEPHEALFAGPDGLDAYREISPGMPRLIAAGGMAAIEIGYDQPDMAAALLSYPGLATDLVHDLAGRPRALVLTHIESK